MLYSVDVDGGGFDEFSCRESVTHSLEDYDDISCITLTLPYKKLTNLDKFVEFIKQYFPIDIEVDGGHIILDNFNRKYIYDVSAILFLLSGWYEGHYTNLEECVKSCLMYYSGQIVNFDTFVYILIRNTPLIDKLLNIGISGQDGPSRFIYFSVEKLVYKFKKNDLYLNILDYAKQLKGLYSQHYTGPGNEYLYKDVIN
jgi:hypothetical protein